MSLDIRRHKDVPTAERARLAEAMVAFYGAPPPSYYSIADGSAQRYSTLELPFHLHLVEQVQPGATVVEVGCGSAHLCPQVEQRGGRYTGLDYSEALLAGNQQRFPQARFLRLTDPLAEQFDIVASLYTIEHVVEPEAYLRRLWNLCRPGGLVAVICPEFVDNEVPPPSLFYGRTARRLRHKFQRLALGDAVGHVLDLKRRVVAWKQAAQAAPPGAFWLNLRPRVLHGAEYVVDADAVHLVRRLDIEWFFRQTGAELVQTSASMDGIPFDILQFNAYVLAHKSVAGDTQPNQCASKA